MLVAALTGNYGMGKSYVLALFREFGAVTLDSDRIVALLLNERWVIEKVRLLLGNDVLSREGGLDKKAVADRIFHDRAAKEKLEALLHPLVFEKIKDFIGKMKNRDSLVIVEVPLLFEGNYESGFEKTITVFTPEETAVERLEAAGVQRTEAIARMKYQLPISEKKARSDYVIDNSGSKEKTKARVNEIYQLLSDVMIKRKS